MYERNAYRLVKSHLRYKKALKRPDTILLIRAAKYERRRDMLKLITLSSRVLPIVKSVEFHFMISIK